MNVTIEEFTALKASDVHLLPSSNKGSLIEVVLLFCRHCLEAIQRPDPDGLNVLRGSIHAKLFA